jgi:excisionase family DNA binding protein
MKEHPLQKATLVLPRHALPVSGRRRHSRADVAQEESATISVPDAARLLGISESAAYEAAARGDIPTLRIGRRVLVVRQALIAMLTAASVAPSQSS